MHWNRPLARGWPALAGLSVIVLALAAGAVWYGLAGWIHLGAPAWGPLAVVDFETGDEALSAGTLRITDKCVFLVDAGNDSSILVWHDKRTRWEAEGREIVFENRDGRDVTLRDGEHVTFSGGGDSVSEGRVPGDEWVAGIDWVARPDPGCPIDSRWFVNELAAPR